MQLAEFAGAVGRRCWGRRRRVGVLILQARGHARGYEVSADCGHGCGYVPVADSGRGHGHEFQHASADLCRQYPRGYNSLPLIST
jgi:hypothetical protein